MLAALNSLPAGARPLVAVVTVLAPLAFIAFVFLDGETRRFLLYAGIALAVIVGIAVLIYERKNKKRADGLSRDLQENAGQNANVRDRDEIAKLDHLKREFQRGLDIYEKRGKSLYSLPWYVIVGEPGSGKTEAVRHSDIPFPPQLQNQRQGTGGTLSMHWWFTNHAVILDTAGRLFFDEGSGGGAKNEWTSFLQMLRKNRPECPINGLVLVIPSTELVPEATESAEQAALSSLRDKAAKIARQFETIQDQLAVRYPVYVVVTKSDKVTGFRELFSSLNDQQRTQMFGWSNPNKDLNAKFEPSWIRNALNDIADRLRKRRTTLLLDPTPDKEDGHRIDDVAGLYNMPISFLELGNKLETYLHDIFAGGTWSGAPPFLRGIYFTSALQEGAVLDKNLAAALGKLVEDLDDQKQQRNAFQIDQAFFIRDLFIDKMFKERGLVTPLGKVKSVGSRIRGWMMAGIAATAAVLAGMAINSELLPADETALWEDLKISFYNKIDQTTRYAELVTPHDTDTGVSQYLGDKKISSANPKSKNNGLSLVAALTELDNLTNDPADVGGLFLPVQMLPRDKEKQRRRAFEILIKKDTLGTLLAAARSKLKEDSAPGPHSKNALLALATLETDIARAKAPPSKAEKSDDPPPPPPAPITAEKLIDDLLIFVLGGETAEESDRNAIAKIVQRIYADGAQWPYEKDAAFPLSDPGSLSTILNNYSQRIEHEKTNLLDKTDDLAKLIEDFHTAYSALATLADSKKNGASFREGRDRLADLRKAAENISAPEFAGLVQISSGKNPGASIGQTSAMLDATRSVLQPLQQLDNAIYTTNFASVFDSNPPADEIPSDESTAQALAPLSKHKIQFGSDPDTAFSYIELPPQSQLPVYVQILATLNDCAETLELADKIKQLDPSHITTISDKREYLFAPDGPLGENSKLGSSLEPIARFIFKSAQAELAAAFQRDLLLFPLVADKPPYRTRDNQTHALNLLKVIAADEDAVSFLHPVIDIANTLFRTSGSRAPINLQASWGIDPSPNKIHPFELFVVNPSRENATSTLRDFTNGKLTTPVSIAADSNLELLVQKAGSGTRYKLSDKQSSPGQWGLLQFILNPPPSATKSSEWVNGGLLLHLQSAQWSPSDPNLFKYNPLSLELSPPGETAFPSKWPTSTTIGTRFQAWSSGTAPATE